VRLPRDPQFDEERERFSLRFCCEDCGHFDGAAERCRHDWPNERHRQAFQGDMIDFCKEFELC
jgi:hypothetical protein